MIIGYKPADYKKLATGYYDGTYLIMNDPAGDTASPDDYTAKAGDKLTKFVLASNDSENVTLALYKKNGQQWDLATSHTFNLTGEDRLYEHDESVTLDAGGVYRLALVTPNVSLYEKAVDSDVGALKWSAQVVKDSLLLSESGNSSWNPVVYAEITPS